MSAFRRVQKFRRRESWALMTGEAFWRSLRPVAGYEDSTGFDANPVRDRPELL
jgi:hypothetical protein